MKLITPQISWHNRLPVLCLDISYIEQPKPVHKLATGGNDSKVYIWNINEEGGFQIRAGLRRHQRTVGAVRFSSNCQLLASGDDDGYIYLWKYSEEQSIEATSNNFLDDDEFDDLEIWKQKRVLRGHVEDICDLSWSKDCCQLVSGSVDNSAILWDVEKGTKLWCSDGIKGYVQGVAFDPLNQFLVTLSSDRSMRIYNIEEKKWIPGTGKKMRVHNLTTSKGVFCDDTLQTFCRRTEFSPCGKFLLTPAGQIIDENSKPASVCFVFKRNKLNKPLLYYKTKENSLCIRFCPSLFKLRDNQFNFWNIPYRLVFAVATSRSILIYDSQQPTPICFISNIHMARPTDLAWSNDGTILMVSSYDGYCTYFSFKKDELGEITLEPPPPEPEPEPVAQPKPPKVNDIRNYMSFNRIT